MTDNANGGKAAGDLGRDALAMVKNMRPAEMLQRGLDAALVMNGQVVTSHLNRMRRSKPNGTPKDTLNSLKKQYLATVTSTGLAVGGAAALPSVGTATALAFSGGEVVAFLEASTLYALAVAELHGVPVQDLERRRTLVTAVLLGDTGTQVVEKTAGRTGSYWGKDLVTKIPMSQINRMNRVLGPRFITKWGTKQGVIVLGRIIPFGIGAAIGAGGNAAVGMIVAKSVERAYGPAPKQFPAHLYTTPDADFGPDVDLGGGPEPEPV